MVIVLVVVSNAATVLSILVESRLWGVELTVLLERNILVGSLAIPWQVTLTSLFLGGSMTVLVLL